MSLFSSVGQMPFWPDSRANRVEKYLRTRDQNGGLRGWLYLCGPEEAAHQVEMAFDEVCRRTPMIAARAAEYTHRFQFDNGVPNEASAMVRLLQRILTLTARPPLDCAVVLDWYKIPPTEDKPYWTNTEHGELLHRSKYWGQGLDRRRARDRLLEEVQDVIKQHPLLTEARYIITCPGHKADGASFGELLARKVAEVTGKQVVETVAVNGARLSMKEGAQDLTDAFRVDQSLAGSALVIDDVYQSGTTMGQVAAAAKAAGASRVVGFAPVRTLKR